MENNPWETYETIFTLGSLHDGVVGKVTDKGASVVFTAYGVEAFAPYRQLMKDDGTPAREGDTLSFRIIEFNKENKRIVASHSRINEEKNREARNAEYAEKDKEVQSTAKVVKKLKDTNEKSTLGDIEALASLKNEMEADAKTKADE